jgi:hypothetical protein
MSYNPPMLNWGVGRASSRTLCSAWPARTRRRGAADLAGVAGADRPARRREASGPYRPWCCQPTGAPPRGPGGAASRRHRPGPARPGCTGQLPSRPGAMSRPASVPAHAVGPSAAPPARRRRFRRNVRPAARAPRTTERRAPRRNRATSSRQPAGASPVRGDARVPGSSTPGVGRDPGVEAEEDRSRCGAGNRPVRSMKRSLQRRQESPRKRPRGSRACIPMAKAMDGTWEPGAGAKEPSGVGGVERSEGCRGNWRGPRWPRAAGREAGPAYNRRGPGSGGRPSGSRRGS